MTKLLTTTALAVLSLVLLVSTPRAGDTSALADLLDQMAKPRMEDYAYVLQNDTVSHNSFDFVIDSIVFYPFARIDVDGKPLRYGGVYFGRAEFRFHPPVRLEQDQVKKFFSSDTLNRITQQGVIYCDSLVWMELEYKARRVDERWTREKEVELRDCLYPFNRQWDYYYLYTVLKNTAHSRHKRFLMVNASMDNDRQLVYMYDPYKPEEVHLLKEHYWPGQRFVELVCLYAKDIDETYENIYGRLDHDQLRARHYDIDASIDRGGNLDAVVRGEFDVIDPTTRFVRLQLNRELEVDSVRTSDGERVWFSRFSDDWVNKSQELYLMFQSPVGNRDTIALDFFYHGDVAERKAGEFHVMASATWYPRYGLNQRTTADMQFRTPSDIPFIVSAELVDSSAVSDTMVTHWRVTRPAINISFNIAHFERYDCEAEGGIPVHVYYNKPLHRSYYRRWKRGIEKDICKDISNSLSMFASLFGRYPYDDLTVGEIIYEHAEAFPGFIHLGAQTWFGTELFGSDELFRSHEVAHQWFGSTVGYATYHDQWLSEGMAEYASLLYLDHVKGHDRFLEILRDYRDEIHSVRNYLLYEGAESGPIILGRRTASTKTKGDYGLIIYRKAALVLHMLRYYMTDWQTLDDSAFFDMLRDFFVTYQDGNPTTLDFQRLVERHVGHPMDWFFRQWIYGNGFPEYTFSYKVQEAARPNWRVVGSIDQKAPDETFRVLMPIEVEFDDGSTQYETVWITDRSTSLDLRFERKPRHVRLNPFEAVLATVDQ